MVRFAARAVALSCVAAALLAVVADAAPPNIIYSISGTFAAPAVSGQDTFQLAGRPFGVRIEANEALQPTRHTRVSALYTNLVLEGEVFSPILPTPLYISTRRASLFLETRAQGSPDLLTIYFPYRFVGLDLTISANVTLPPGTISTTAIQPFTTAAPLTPSSATATYSNTSASTTLAVANGTFNATVGPPPSAIATVHKFSGGDGLAPLGLTAGSTGVLYGTTVYGGTPGAQGTVFKLTRTPGGPWTETVLYNFMGGSDGANPAGGLVIGSGGTLYGTTTSGGASNAGTVFELTPGVGGAWTESVIYNFVSPGFGSSPNPVGTLVAGGNGVLYGVTEFGGAASAGTVFQLTPPPVPGGAWSQTFVYEFTGQNGDGAYPLAGLMMEPNGSLYGTTSRGGIMNAGTVFRVTLSGSAWTETVLYSFAGAPDGSTPQGPLVAANGILYGTTAYGGNGAACLTGCGTAFALAPRAAPEAWSENVIYNFQGAAAGDGYNPAAPLTIGSGGALFGATPYGGIEGWGTVFRLTPGAPGGEWSESILASFSFFDGASPAGALATGSQGALYGSAGNGGSSPCAPQSVESAFCGTVFEVTP